MKKSLKRRQEAATAQIAASHAQFQAGRRNPIEQGPETALESQLRVA